MIKNLKISKKSRHIKPFLIKCKKLSFMCLHLKPLYFVIFLMLFANLSKADICGPEFDQQKPSKTSIEIDAAQTDDENLYSFILIKV